MATAARMRSPDPAPQGGGRFASPAVLALMRQRTARLGGLVLGLLGLTLLVALLTYDPRDPSFDTATTRHAANLAGPVGAFLADLLLQGFGLGRCAARRRAAGLGLAAGLASRPRQRDGAAGRAGGGAADPGGGARRRAAAAGGGLADGGRAWRRDRGAAWPRGDGGRARRPRAGGRAAGLGAWPDAGADADPAGARSDRGGVARGGAGCNGSGARVGIGRPARFRRAGAAAGAARRAAPAVSPPRRSPRAHDADRHVSTPEHDFVCATGPVAAPFADAARPAAAPGPAAPRPARGHRGRADARRARCRRCCRWTSRAGASPR